MPESTHAQRSGTGQSNVRSAQDFSNSGASASEAALEAFKQYARERPEIVTMWAFGLGFVFGWKLRIW